jgi:thiol-disulfide isomerase/thioredoxin
MKLRCVLLLLFAFLALRETASAIELGSPAPPLNVTSWVKGEPVELSAVRGKKVVVVEFWATWCPPCRESIPHLTELQKKYKEVAIVGVTDEEVPVVKRFVNQMGDKMDYSIGVDADQKTLPLYMAEFLPQAPIPWAYIVDKQGVVVWGGSAVPGGGMDEALADVVAGKLTGEMAKRREVARKQLNEFMELATAGKDEAKLEQLGKSLEALDAELGGIQPGKKFNATEVRNRIKFERLQNDYFMALMAGNSATNLNRLEQKLVEVAPPDFDLADFKEVATLTKDFNDYMRAASGRGDTNRIPELTRRIAGTKIKTFDPLLQVAWNIVIGESLNPRDLDLAASLAKRAVELTGEKNIDALFVYGRTLSEGGKVADAIKWHKKAIAAAGDNEGARKRLEADLASYEAKLKEN